MAPSRGAGPTGTGRTDRTDGRSFRRSFGRTDGWTEIPPPVLQGIEPKDLHLKKDFFDANIQIVESGTKNNICQTKMVKKCFVPNQLEMF